MKAGDRVKVFQSTPPVRGATVDSMSDPYAWIISIHAPRAGGDEQGGYRSVADGGFQSTPPVRGATGSGGKCCYPVP